MDLISVSGGDGRILPGQYLGVNITRVINEWWEVAATLDGAGRHSVKWICASLFLLFLNKRGGNACVSLCVEVE